MILNFNDIKKIEAYHSVEYGEKIDTVFLHVYPEVLTYIDIIHRLQKDDAEYKTAQASCDVDRCQ